MFIFASFFIINSDFIMNIHIQMKSDTINSWISTEFIFPPRIVLIAQSNPLKISTGRYRAGYASPVQASAVCEQVDVLVILL